MLPALSWVALVFLSGLVFAEYSNIPLSACFALLAVTIATWALLSIVHRPAFWLVRKDTRIGLAPIFLFFFFLLGIFRYQLATPSTSQHDLAWYQNSGIVSVSGEIYGYPDRRDTYPPLTDCLPVQT
jgi:hypothetical protein